MRISSLSRGLVLAALCIYSPVCFAQAPVRGAIGGQPGMMGGQGQATVDKSGRPLTGQLAAGLEPFDAKISPLLQKYDIPGCVIAVMDNDSIVMVRGYGWADKEARVPISPDSVFRIADLSQTVTATAILMLAEEGKLKLEAPVLPLLPELTPLDGATPDPRLSKITIRQLLQHSGGWDEAATFNPFDRLGQIATTAKVASPPDINTIIRYMMGQPLQFDPGTKSAYSNFGYLLLGKVVEKVSGLGYEDYLNSKLFDKMGTQSFRLGATRKQERDLNEVKYYDYKGAPSATSLFDAPAMAPRPDGSVGMEVRGGSSGWIANASDYLRFLSVVDAVETVTDVLSYNTLVEVARRPDYGLKDETYWGLGWMVRPTRAYDPKFPNTHKPEVYGSWWHEGSMPGSSVFAARDSNGRAWVALFNSHPQDSKAWSNDMMEALDMAMADSQFNENPGGGEDPNNPGLNPGMIPNEGNGNFDQ
ncbi:class A beta-lactamase-related serine hydrolase [bacterium]|nr:MAG: class A beta-lactamase-related serine hydrolase [bacterium]